MGSADSSKYLGALLGLVTLSCAGEVPLGSSTSGGAGNSTSTGTGGSPGSSNTQMSTGSSGGITATGGMHATGGTDTSTTAGGSSATPADSGVEDGGPSMSGLLLLAADAGAGLGCFRSVILIAKTTPPTQSCTVTIPGIGTASPTTLVWQFAGTNYLIEPTTSTCMADGGGWYIATNTSVTLCPRTCSFIYANPQTYIVPYFAC